MHPKTTHLIAARTWDALTIIIPAALVVALTWLLHRTGIERLLERAHER